MAANRLTAQKFNACVLVALALFTGLTFSLNLECYKCRSNIDPECATNPGQQIEVEECFLPTDKCLTGIFDRVTHRGCASNVVPSGQCYGKWCTTCNTSLCNGEIYPPDRLKCFQCSGSDCVDLTNKTHIEARPCPLYEETDRCSTNIIKENNVRRGCESTNRDETCKNVCLKCNYDACNNEPGVTNHTCYSCRFLGSVSSNFECNRLQEVAEEGKCAVKDLTTCVNKVIYGHKVGCYTHFDNLTGVVERGCSQNKPFFPNGRTWECDDEFCNSDCVDMKCNVCDSTKDAKCANLTISLNPSKCPEGTKSCFSYEEGERVIRGCGTSTNQAAYHCFDRDGCNKGHVRTCYRCTSTHNENCAHMNDSRLIAQELCARPDESCVATLGQRLNIVYTVRGCESTVIECTDGDPFCQRCNGSLCNDHVLNWSSQEWVEKLRVFVKRNANSSTSHRSMNSIHLLTILFILYSNLLND